MPIQGCQPVVTTTEGVEREIERKRKEERGRRGREKNSPTRGGQGRPKFKRERERGIDTKWATSFLGFISGPL